jgi:hypothetical protein
VRTIILSESGTIVNRKRAWRSLPYGQGITACGDTIIFDRDYRPLLRVCGDGRAEPCDGSFVQYEPQRWFFTDSNAPHRDAETRRRISELIETTPRLLQAIEARRATFH